MKTSLLIEGLLLAVLGGVGSTDSRGKQEILDQLLEQARQVRCGPHMWPSACTPAVRMSRREECGQTDSCPSRPGSTRGRPAGTRSQRWREGWRQHLEIFNAIFAAWARGWRAAGELGPSAEPGDPGESGPWIHGGTTRRATTGDGSFKPHNSNRFSCFREARMGTDSVLNSQDSNISFLRSSPRTNIMTSYIWVMKFWTTLWRRWPRQQISQVSICQRNLMMRGNTSILMMT